MDNLNPNQVKIELTDKFTRGEQPHIDNIAIEIGKSDLKYADGYMKDRINSKFGSKFVGSKFGVAHNNGSKENKDVSAAVKDAGVILQTEKKELLGAASLEKHMPQPAESDKYAGKEEEYGLGRKPWHLMSEDQILNEFSTNMDTGYSDFQYEVAYKKYGPNRITPKKSRSWIMKLLLNMLGGFQIFLWVGFVLSLIVYFITNMTDYQTLALGIICLIIVVGTSLFQTIQEGKSDDVMAALKALTPENVKAYRNQIWVTVAAVSLVPGDIIEAKNGDKVPADVRVLKSFGLKVNNASLTGENVDINLGPTTDSKTLYEAKNLARMGCNFTAGNGICIVFSTGDDTFFGHIAKSTLNIKRPESCLTREIHRLVKIMGIIAVSLGVLFLILALIRGYKAVDAIIFMIGIIVANVPEGLLPQMTVALTLTARKMQKKDVVVTNLEIIETLGAVSVICSDKTGTLTCNRMTVSHLVYDMDIFSGSSERKKEVALDVNNADKVENDISKIDIEKPYDVTSSTFKELLKIMTVCSTCVFDFDKCDKNENVLNWLTKYGDASEAALIKFSQPIRDILEHRNEYTEIYKIDFNSNNKWMLKIIQSKSDPTENGGRFTYLLKGAPDKIINFCTKYLYKGQILPMNSQITHILKLNERLAQEGERVLGFACKVADIVRDPKHEFGEDGYGTTKFDFDEFVFIGLVSLQDPPREGVKESIAKCFQAGIRVFMVTGDQPLTAESIAKQLGLISSENGIQHKKNDVLLKMRPGFKVVHGVDLLNYTEEMWKDTLSYSEVVFARTMPQQKQDIVNNLKKDGSIIAMTGDGVNDAPALKAAHVGIAMGSGASVAKEAGQLILLKDDFTNIVDGIQEGRLIFENLKKCICYVLTSNIPELIPFLLFIILKIPLSIETIMILLVDVGTDLAPAVSLAWEMEEAETMKLPPRTLESHLVGSKLFFVSYVYLGLLTTFAAYWAWAWVYYDYGFTIYDLLGAGIQYRDKWVDMSLEAKDFFGTMCLKNAFYQSNYVIALGQNCQQDFKDHLVDLMYKAQTAFLMTIVWQQMILIFMRKTASESVFSMKRLFNNIPLFYSILIELIIILLVVYVPGLNKALLLIGIDSKYAATALWFLPLIAILEEFRKWLIRLSPGGCVDACTKF